MRGLSVADLLARGALSVGERLTLSRKGTTHEATVLEDGKLKLEDGSVFASLSTAAGSITGTSTNGWPAWQVPRLGKTMAEVRDNASSAA